MARSRSTFFDGDDPPPSGEFAARLVPFLKTILTRRLVDLDALDLGGGNGLDTIDPEPIRGEIEAVLASSRSLPPEDPKLDRLLVVVSEKEELENNKLLIFNSFRHTLAYLEHALNERGVRVGLIHGDVPDEERRRLRAAFATPRSDGGAHPLSSAAQFTPLWNRSSSASSACI